MEAFTAVNEIATEVPPTTINKIIIVDASGMALDIDLACGLPHDMKESKLHTLVVRVCLRGQSPLKQMEPVSGVRS
jgi:hypothetical protein